MTVTIYGAPEGWDAILLGRRAVELDQGARGAIAVHVARGDARADRLANQLQFFAPDVDVLRFPAWDCLPYDRVSPNALIVSERIATLSRLLEPGARPRVLLTTVNALIQRVPPRHVFRGAGLTLEKAGRCDPNTVARFAEANGYGRAATVMEPGEYAIRGGIIDIFPAGETTPVRIDLFGEDIESIRRFDPISQRSGSRVERLVLRPVGEVSLDQASVARFRSGWREQFGNDAASDPLYQSVSDGRRHPGMEHYLPLFHEATETLFDYTPGASLSFDNQDDEVLTARLEMIADHYQARKSVPRDGEVPYRALPPDRLYLDRAGYEALIGAQHGGLVFTPYARPDGGAQGIDAGGRPGPIYTQSGGAGSAYVQLAQSAEKWHDDRRRVLLAAWSRGARERLASLLREHAIRAESVEDYAAARKLPARTIGIVTVGLDRGFLADDLAVVAEQDLLGERISRPARRRKRADQFIAEATEIVEGDLIVHQDYGVGRYDGLETLVANNVAVRWRAEAVPAGGKYRAAVPVWRGDGGGGAG
jgi:transcription-repair coupling factor (superfamily II helicase)